MLLITESKLAEILGVSNRTLQNQRINGTGLPFKKIGKVIRYDFDLIMKYLEEQQYFSTDQAKMSKLNKMQR